MRLKIDDRVSDYYFGSKLIGYDSNGNKEEFDIITDSTGSGNFDILARWSDLQKIIVLDEFGDEVILDTTENEVTGFQI